MKSVCGAPALLHLVVASNFQCAPHKSLSLRNFSSVTLSFLLLCAIFSIILSTVSFANFFSRNSGTFPLTNRIKDLLYALLLQYICLWQTVYLQSFSSPDPQMSPRWVCKYFKVCLHLWTFLHVLLLNESKK